MIKFWFVTSVILGFLSVALGAFGAHSLKNLLNDYGRSLYEKAVLYQMFHSIALLMVGLFQYLFRDTSFSLAGWSFLVGIILFSGSLYLLAITGLQWLGMITPVGGTAFLLGWFCFLWAMIKTHL